VEPEVVVEIAFDVVHASTRHKSGFALRFPRIVRIRDDKTPDDIDCLSTVAALHERLQVAGRYGVMTGEGTPNRAQRSTTGTDDAADDGEAGSA